MHSIQIYCAKTHTLIGKFIRFAIRGHYNHCAVGLDNSRNLYSFSRFFYYMWFTGVFREENVSFYSTYKCYSLDVTDEQFHRILGIIAQFSDGLHIYNYLSAALLPLGIAVPPVGTCSTFTATILAEIVQLDKSPLLYTPVDILKLMEVLKIEEKSQLYNDSSGSCCKSGIIRL